MTKSSPSYGFRLFCILTPQFQSTKSKALNPSKSQLCIKEGKKTLVRTFQWITWGHQAISSQKQQHYILTEHHTRLIGRVFIKDWCIIQSNIVSKMVGNHWHFSVGAVVEIPKYQFIYFQWCGGESSSHGEVNPRVPNKNVRQVVGIKMAHNVIK